MLPFETFKKSAHRFCRLDAAHPRPFLSSSTDKIITHVLLCLLCCCLAVSFALFALLPFVLLPCCRRGRHQRNKKRQAVSCLLACFLSALPLMHNTNPYHPHHLTPLLREKRGTGQIRARPAQRRFEASRTFLILSTTPPPHKKTASCSIHTPHSRQSPFHTWLAGGWLADGCSF